MAPDIHHSKENALVSLKVGQLIYTSFRESGFTLLTSPDIPPFVQQSFVKKLVQAHWDTYHPPSPGYRAAYLYQLPLAAPGVLFGWLYHDGHDELGRSDIPYFVCYHLSGPLQYNQLSLILAVLQKGPEGWIDRSDYLLNDLEPLILENKTYKPARKGVLLPAQIWEESHAALQSQTLLNWFFPDSSLVQPAAQPQPIIPADIEPQVYPQITPIPLESESIHVLTETAVSNKVREPIETNLDSLNNQAKSLEIILKELVSKPIGIQGAVLVSAEGQAMIPPVGLDEQLASIIAGTMLYLAKSTQQELHWPNIEAISVRSQEGYMLLSNCSDDIYLLIKSDKVPMGLLEGEISRTITRLRFALDAEKVEGINESKTTHQVNQTSLMTSEKTIIQTQPSPEPTAIIPSDPSSEVTYRGRRISS
jgi:predicted regulator of Ras-like GTPase activity (Roadblock/LC7/MglB family)